jgi:Ca-activated chloride channel family protein
MRLAHPILLLLILLVPLLVWVRFFLKKGTPVPFSNAEVLKPLPQTWRVRIQPLRPLLYALGLFCLLVALARPQKGLDESRVHTVGVDILLLLDLSESMDTPDFVKANRRISRLDATKDVVERFLKKRPNDRIGIVGFASLPYAIAPLTLDHDWLIDRLEGLHTGMLDGRHTAIGDGLASAVNRLRDSEAKSKVVILLTDGANNYGTLAPENAARAAKALGIKIYAIGAGGAGNGFFMRRPEVDEDTLREVAKSSGGKFFRARDLDSLQAVYDEIDQLEKTEIEVEQYTRFEEAAGAWIVAGILLLLMEQGISLSRIGRLS